MKLKKGEEVVILESMKMEIPIESSTTGIVKKIYHMEGDFVQENTTILIIE